MTDQNSNQSDASAVKNPDDWTTGEEPATQAQLSYIETMATEAGEAAPDKSMTKSEASKLIEELQNKTSRG